jgi:MFS transporter, ACS family, pantothenate transporter
MGFLLKLRTAVWGAPAATKTERHLIFKIDCFILSYVCLMVRRQHLARGGPVPTRLKPIPSKAYLRGQYWVNYLDRANLNNAYVSGMREDLNFQGTQLNQINTCFYGMS